MYIRVISFVSHIVCNRNNHMKERSVPNCEMTIVMDSDAANHADIK